MKNRLFHILVLLLIPASLCAQTDPFLRKDSIPAFREGEVLEYAVSYSAKIMSTNVADVEMSVHVDTMEGHKCYRLIGSGRTRRFFDLFFRVSDVYTSWIDARTLKPYRAASNQKEGGYEYESDFRFKWGDRIAMTTGHNIKKDRYYRYRLPLEENSFDALTIFYNLRMADFSQAKEPGDRFAVSLVLEDTVRTLYLTYHGKERIKNKKFGNFNTMKFSCVFATSTDESFKDGSEFFIWMSDDKNKIPIYLESPVVVGKIYAYLSGYSNLVQDLATAE